MKIQLWWTGNTKPEVLNTLLQDYVHRIGHYTKFEVKEFKQTKGILSAAETIKAEEIALNKSINRSNAFVIVLDENGKSFTSRDFAKFVELKATQNYKTIIFIIGGAFGFSQNFKQTADLLISFSNFTLSHQLIRLVFLEQLYRAFTIINNQSYHND